MFVINKLRADHVIDFAAEELKEYLKSLIPYGLDGIEGYYTDYTPEMQERYQAMAKELGLVISGGTDYHGANKPHIAIGKGRGNLEIPYTVLEGLRERLANLLNVPVSIGENPQDEVALGCCIAASDDRVYQKLSASGCLLEV